MAHCLELPLQCECHTTLFDFWTSQELTDKLELCEFNSQKISQSHSSSSSHLTKGSWPSSSPLLTLYRFLVSTSAFFSKWQSNVTHQYLTDHSCSICTIASFFKSKSTTDCYSEMFGLWCPATKHAARHTELQKTWAIDAFHNLEKLLISNKTYRCFMNI